jgi:hypothetical protein
MENPGLFTLNAAIVLGDPADDVFARHFVRTVAHELAHLWFGDRVTPAWWDDLWWAEAFASWLGDQVAHDADGFDDFALRMALTRQTALAADDEPGVRALRLKVESNADPDRLGFDTIAYEKGEQVIETFFGQGDLRRFVHGHMDGIATSEDVIALAKEPLRPALRSYLDRAGVPVIDLALTCVAGSNQLESTVRDGFEVPFEVAIDGNVANEVSIAGRSRGVVSLDACPTSIAPHAGNGYYEIAWADHTALGPRFSSAQLLPRDAVAYGDDVAGAFTRGELAPHEALAALSTLRSRMNDPYAQLGALAIARAIDPLVDDATRPAWSRWLANRFARQLTTPALLAPRTPAATELRDALVATISPSALQADVVKAAVQTRASALAHDAIVAPQVVAAAAPLVDNPTFEHIAALAAAGRSDAFVALGELPADRIARTVELVLGSDAPADVAWPAIGGFFARGETRSAAWRAVQPRAVALAHRLGDELQTAIAAVGLLCDASSRDEVAATLTPLATSVDAREALARALTRIARCVARRAQAEGLASALRN